MGGAMMLYMHMFVLAVSLDIPLNICGYNKAWFGRFLGFDNASTSKNLCCLMIDLIIINRVYEKVRCNEQAIRDNENLCRVKTGPKKI